MSDIHALIQGFLQQQTIHPLSQTQAEGVITKAGVVPFLREEGFRYYVMKPRGFRPELGAPLFQLCKGTRMYHVPGVGWHDMREAGSSATTWETLAETALREGTEELGLKLENISRLFDVGVHNFASAKTGVPRRMALYAAELAEPDDFLPERDIATTTAECKWLTLAEFEVAGRPDHHYILKEIEARLVGHYKE